MRRTQRSELNYWEHLRAARQSRNRATILQELADRSTVTAVGFLLAPFVENDLYFGEPHFELDGIAGLATGIAAYGLRRAARYYDGLAHASDEVLLSQERAHQVISA